MAIDNRDFINRCHELTAPMEPGGFTLPELFGEEWVPIREAGQAKTLGTVFSRAVRAGEFPDVEFSHVQRYPRMNVWRKVVAGRE